MKPDWILVANSAHARLLERETGSPTVVVQSFQHPQSRLKTSDLVTDHAGHEDTDRSYGGSSFQPRTEPKRKEHERFARELADFLEQAAGDGRYRAVMLFASSPFLGELKAELGSATQRLLASTHDMDLTSFGLSELERRIEHELEEPQR